MEKGKWAFVVFLIVGAFMFLFVSLYKKTVLSNSSRSPIHQGELYNLKKLSPQELDSLQGRDEYLYLLHRGTGTNQSDSGILFFREAHLLKPNAAFPCCMLGRNFINNQQYDSALLYLNLALKISPDYNVAKHYQNIAVHRKNGEEDFD